MGWLQESSIHPIISSTFRGSNRRSWRWLRHLRSESRELPTAAQQRWPRRIYIGACNPYWQVSFVLVVGFSATETLAKALTIRNQHFIDPSDERRARAGVFRGSPYGILGKNATGGGDYWDAWVFEALEEVRIDWGVCRGWKYWRWLSRMRYFPYFESIFDCLVILIFPKTNIFCPPWLRDRGWG